MSKQTYIGANKQMQDIRKRRGSNSFILDFDKVKEPVHAATKPG